MIVSVLLLLSVPLFSIYTQHYGLWTTVALINYNYD